MRFGITPLEMANVLQIIGEGGIPDFSNFNFVDIISIVREHGFSLMELTMDVTYVLPGGLTEETVKALKKVKKELGLTFTAHLPLWAIEPSCPNTYIRQASIDCLVDAINLVKPLEPEVYVLHATGALASEFSRLQIPSIYKSFITKHFNNLAGQSIEGLLKRTKIPSRRLAIENIEFPLQATCKLAEELDTSICFDTGHLLAGYSGTISVLEFLDRYYDRIAEIHLHDGGYYPVEDNLFRRFDHQALGTGDLPIKEFLGELQERGYDGPIIFELTLKEAKESLDIIRQRLPDLPID
ncbi:MAG: cobamide remodeling phosphodiesterase CbiR [Promethearchaeota archaeon]